MANCVRLGNPQRMVIGRRKFVDLDIWIIGGKGRPETPEGVGLSIATLSQLHLGRSSHEFLGDRE